MWFAWTSITGGNMEVRISVHPWNDWTSLTQLGQSPANSRRHRKQPDNNQPTQLAAGPTKTFPGSSWLSCFSLKTQVRHSGAPVPFPSHGHKINGETWRWRENHHPSYLVYHKKVFIEDFSRLTILLKDSDLLRATNIHQGIPHPLTIE